MNLQSISSFIALQSARIRSTFTGAIMMLAVWSGFIPLETGSGIEFGSLALPAAFFVGYLAFGATNFIAIPLWTKITPVTDRVTHWEDEVVFLLSSAMGLALFLILPLQIPVVAALFFILVVLTATLPICFMNYLFNSTVRPIETLDVGENVRMAEEFRNDTPQFWSNALAYIGAGVASGAIPVVVVLALVIVRGSSLQLSLIPTIILSSVLINVVAVPFFIMLGRLFDKESTYPSGKLYVLGGTAMIMFLLALNIFRLATAGAVGLLTIGCFIVAAVLIILSYMLGGWVFDRLYQAEAPAVAFN